jgi:hypothetical protein
MSADSPFSSAVRALARRLLEIYFSQKPEQLNLLLILRDEVQPWTPGHVTCQVHGRIIKAVELLHPATKNMVAFTVQVQHPNLVEIPMRCPLDRAEQGGLAVGVNDCWVHAVTTIYKKRGVNGEQVHGHHAHWLKVLKTPKASNPLTTLLEIYKNLPPVDQK